MGVGNHALDCQGSTYGAGGMGLIIAHNPSAYRKAAERVAQKKTGAVRSRSVNCECAQLLPGDRGGITASNTHST